MGTQQSKADHDLSNDEENRQLRDSLAKADRERKSICNVMLLMVVLFMLSLAGLGYCALLLPQGVFNPARLRHHELERLEGLASLIAQLEFSGYLLWHRIAVNRLHKECRRRGLLLVETQFNASLRSGPAASPSPTQL